MSLEATYIAALLLATCALIWAWLLGVAPGAPHAAAAILGHAVVVVAVVAWRR